MQRQVKQSLQLRSMLQQGLFSFPLFVIAHFPFLLSVRSSDAIAADPNFFQTAACCFIKCFPDFCRCMDFTTPPRRPFPVKFPRKVSLLHCITLFWEFNQIFQLHTEFTNIYSSVAFEPSSVIFTVFRPLFSPVFSLFLFSSDGLKILFQKCTNSPGFYKKFS